MSKAKEQTKESVWLIKVKQETLLKVVFDRELSKEEALEAYEIGEFVDVIDEDVVYEEVIDAS